ncbi:MAG: hypothetical protein WA687_13475 [Solirubrobacterales bacterium]
MIAGLKPYPAYKDSGVEWLGEVPEGWEVRRQSSLMDLWISTVDKHQVDSERPIRLCNYVDVYRNDRIRSGMYFPRGTALDEEVKRFRLRTEDVLITKDSESWDDIASPALVEDGADDLVCGYHLAMLRARRGLSGAYLFWASQSLPVAYQYHVSANGVTRFGLTQGAIKRVEIPVPPSMDQAAIVRFLGYVDSRIQWFIAAKERLIELLENEKRAIVLRAITQGIDSSVPLKPSSVEWLGDLPVHWEVRRAKWCFREIDERSVGGDEELLSVSHLTGVTPRAEKQVTMFQAESYIGHKICRAGDLVVNTMWAWMGALGVSPKTGLVSPSYAVYRPRQSSVDSRYVEHLLTTSTYVAEFNRCSTGIQASRLRLYPEDFLRIPILCPPLDEQRAIVNAIDTAISRRELIGAAVRDQVHRLREYRMRLISDVVTGKLDVRAAVATLPEDPDADDPALDERLEEVAAG